MRAALKRLVVAAVVWAPLAAACGTKIVDLGLDAGPAPARDGPLAAAAPPKDGAATPPFPKEVCVEEQTDGGVCKSCWDQWGVRMGPQVCKPSGCKVMFDVQGQSCLYCAESDFKVAVGCVKCQAPAAGQPCRMCVWTDLSNVMCKQCYRQDGALEFDGCAEIRPELKEQR